MKLVLKIGVVCVLLLLVGVFAVFMYIDGIARAGIERGATYALGVETTLGQADVGVLSGTFDMSGLKVKNPEGFGSEHFLSLGDGGVAVSLGSLRSELVELPKLSLSDLDLVLEKKDGKSNYKVILDNLGRFESKTEDPKKPDKSSEGKKFVVREVEITNVKVHVDLLPIGGELMKSEIPIDRIYLTDVGTDSDKGVVLGELSGVLLKAIMMAIVNKGGGLIPGDVIGDLSGQLANLQGLQDMGIGVVTGAGEQAKALTKQGEALVKELGGAVDDAKKQVEDAGKTLEDAGEKAGEALDGITDIFGGGGKKEDK